MSAPVPRELAILGAAAGVCLGAAPARDLRGLAEGLNWPELHALSAQNRMTNFLVRGLALCGLETDPGFDASVKAYQHLTLAANTANLVTCRRLAPLFRQAGLDVAVFKGPIAQHQIYGGFFLKPSTDVDLLVRGRDYAAARRLLTENGFTLPPECSSAWWRIFLGEQHLVSGDPREVTVDLHYRLQQPGCPAPTTVEAFLSDLDSVPVGAVGVPSPSRAMTCLIACMNLAKALRHREAAGGLVCDIAALLIAGDAAWRGELERAAARLRLANTLRLGVRAAHAVLGVAARPGDAAVLSEVDDETLARMVLAPGGVQDGWPRARRLLSSLCDTTLQYAGEAGLAVVADLCRALVERRDPRLDPV